MKQAIEIEVPDGKKVIWKDNKIVFEDIKPQLPKTWKEFCKYNKIKEEECYLDTTSCIVKADISERHSCIDKNILPNEQAAKAHLALMQLHQLRDCYRQGWIPDWTDNTEKYYIEHRKYCDGIVSYYVTAHINTHIIKFLSFQSKELAIEFLDNFKDLIEQAGDLI